MESGPGPPPIEVTPKAKPVDCDWSPHEEESPLAAVPAPFDIFPVVDDEHSGATDQDGSGHEHPAAAGGARARARMPEGASASRRTDGDAPTGGEAPPSAEELSDFARFRERLRKVVEHGAFMGSVYLVIGYDTLLIANDDLAAQRQPRAPIHKIVEISDWVILVIFTLELILKLLAYGTGGLPSCSKLWERLLGKHADGDESSSTQSTAKEEGDEKDHEGVSAGKASALEKRLARKTTHKGFFLSAWNQFDFFIVVSTWVLIPVQYLMANNETVGRLVRLFRIARPLRAFRSFDGTKDVLKTFPRAIPDMGDVLALLSFIMIVYAILGINLFGLEGQFHGRCVVEDGYATGTHGLLLKGNLDDAEPLCGSDETCPMGFRCSCKAQLLRPDNRLEKAPYAFADPVAGDPGCVYQEAARAWVEDGEFNPEPQCPHYGYECYDNFILALYTIFTKVTLDSWTSSMWFAQDAAGEVVGLVFFLSLVGVVAFNVVNLNVAVISSSHSYSCCYWRSRSHTHTHKHTLML